MGLSLRKIMILLLIVPMLAGAIVGFVSISSFSSDLTAKRNAELALNRADIITALIGEYTAFLTAAAEIEAIRDTAAKKPIAKEQATALISAYVKNGLGVYDMLITDNRGEIFTSYSGDYNDGEFFRDVSELIDIAPTPTPVSNFYEGGKFYVAKPIGEFGYIILIAESNLIPDLISQPHMGIWGNIGVYDENDYFIDTVSDGAKAKKSRDSGSGAFGSIDGTKWNWVADYTFMAINPSISVTFLMSFTVGAGVCLINLIIMLIISKYIKQRID